MQTYSIVQLPLADLVVDAIYTGGRGGNAGDDPLSRLISVSNQGGFRYRGEFPRLEMLALVSSLADADWPDGLDRETGVFTYFGDNKKPGRELHSTPRHGNEILRDLFHAARAGPEARAAIPPVLVFANTGTYRDVTFLGLAVPGTGSADPTDDLVAIWRVSDRQRFQNYRARFSILNTPTVSRAWLADIINRNTSVEKAPAAWTEWLATGIPSQLRAERTVEHRTKQEQLADTEDGRSILAAIRAYFRLRPHAFESCAVRVAEMLLESVASIDLTRPTRDGGRDAVGVLRIGKGATSILVEFALEAKCYEEGNSVGVREVSRLISRLRHRQFGVLVTTGHVDLQAYKEIKEDQHPIIIIAARDIVDILRASGLTRVGDVEAWLSSTFPNS